MKKYFLGSVGLIVLSAIVWIGAGVSAQTGFFSGPRSPRASTTLVLSQVGQGGGGSTGTYIFDYVEIKNISGVSQSLNGLSLYYGSTTGVFASNTATNAFAMPNVSIAPGQYYLVQLGTAGTAGAALPVTPDAVSSGLAMQGNSGKIALVNTAGFPQNTCGSGAAPCSTAQLAQIVDWVAYGAAGNGTAGNGEGGTATNNGVALTTVQGSVRKTGGCTDTDNNNADFDVITNPVPRNMASTVAPCAGGPTPTPTPSGTPTPTPSVTPTPTPSPGGGSPSIVISQIYGGGGASGAQYTNDFVELFNRGTSPASINGWSFQYASATGTSWIVNNLPNATIQPGRYFLIQFASDGAIGSPLPTPDHVAPAVTVNGSTFILNLSRTTAKVALVNTITQLPASVCPADPSIVDLVGYGSGASCFEGTRTADLSASSAALRKRRRQHRYRQ